MRLTGENPILAARKYKLILKQNYLEPCGIDWKPPTSYTEIMEIIRQQPLPKDDEDKLESEEPEEPQKKKKQKIN
jgi:hypothetical protein